MFNTEYVNAMKIITALLLAFSMGVATGTYVSERRGAQGALAFSELQDFRACIAPLRTNAYMNRLWFDAASETRFIEVFVKQTACMRENHIGGLSLGDVERASGFRYAPTKGAEVSRGWESL
jgi:hypothetical protein